MLHILILKKYFYRIIASIIIKLNNLDLISFETFFCEQHFIQDTLKFVKIIILNITTSSKIHI